MSHRKATFQHVNELTEPGRQTYGDWPIWKHTIAFPSSVMMGSSGTPLLETYLVVGTAWYQVVASYLDPAGSAILDIGCGCAKLARHLLSDPRVRRYHGFDPLRPCIDWCQAYVGPKAGDRFRFEHIDVHSHEYNPSGTLSATLLEFPTADRSVDIAVAASVFTHLLEPAARRYLQESRRVLSEQGRLILILHTEPASGSRYSGDEARIDVDLEYFIGMANDAGLALDDDLGSLCGQTALVLRRA